MTAHADIPLLILPGIGNSGPTHWQTLWQQHTPAARRIEQRSWDQPACADWVAALDATLRRYTTPPLLVAHSLACLMVAHWVAHAAQASPHNAGHTAPSVHAALLVAPPDPAAPAFPAEATGFAPLPTARFGFPAIVVSSSDDPYGSPAHAEAMARAWGARHVRLGALGHINAASNLGEWPAGQALLQELMQAT